VSLPRRWSTASSFRRLTIATVHSPPALNSRQSAARLELCRSCHPLILGGSKYDHVTTCIGCEFLSASRSNSLCSSTKHCTALLQSTSSRCAYQSRRPRQDHRCAQRQGATSLFHALSSSSASAPSHSPVQQLGTVYLTLYEALNQLTLSKDYLNPFYFQSHTLAFHSQLQHVIPLRCINLCNAPL